MKKVDYDERLHDVYAAGRQMSPVSLQTWMEAFARHLPDTRPLVWLDLGSGTGRMTPSLASAFGGPAHGVEPSDKMRAQALAHSDHPDVTYTAGSGEHIPLPDASCDAALLFFVWHHVIDRNAAARELRRVVKPGGKLFVQANLSDKMPDTWWFRVVPEWRKIDQAQFRSEAQVIGDFADAGWSLAFRDESHLAPLGESGRGRRETQAAGRIGLRAHEPRGRRGGLRHDRGSAALTRRGAAIRDQRAARLPTLASLAEDLGGPSTRSVPGRGVERRCAVRGLDADGCAEGRGSLCPWNQPARMPGD
jgi:ubiquinone/menaquinone biosynthesis C-methylase UbiE